VQFQGQQRKAAPICSGMQVLRNQVFSELRGRLHRPQNPWNDITIAAKFFDFATYS